jgi:hypothetical protein
MRRFGLASSPGGNPEAARSASAPVSTSPSRPANTLDGSIGDPSNSSGVGGLAPRRSTATVFEVPKSTASATVPVAMSATLRDRIDLYARLSPSADCRWNGDGTTWNIGRPRREKTVPVDQMGYLSDP